MIRGGALALAVVCAALGATFACGTGDPSAPERTPAGWPTSVDAPATPVATETRVLGATVVRRLNRVEFDRTLRDLLGADVLRTLPSAPSASLPLDGVAQGFDTNAAALKVSPQFVEEVMFVADALAENYPVARSGCIEGSDEASCVRTFVTSFGKRAWRRPLEADEVDAIVAFWQERRADEGFDGSIRAIVARFIQSPFFLYRVEMPRADLADRAGRNRGAREATTPVDSYAMASRLSYLLWHTMPDDTLFARADHDELRNRAVVLQEAERMMKDERARDMVKRFHSSWLGTEGLDSVDKVFTAYPDFPTVRASLKRESDLFVEDVVLDGPGDVASIFTSTTAWVNKDTARLYGLTSDSEDFTRVELDPGTRAGILTRAPLLSRLAKADRSSPILRGVFVRDRVLCMPFDPPPPNASSIPADMGEAKTTRAFFAALTSSDMCQSCHKDINALGFGFENYDEVGRYRTNELGEPVDATGTLSVADLTGPFDGAVQLSARLASSERVRNCITRQWFRYSYGRSEATGDEAAIVDLERRFAESGYQVRGLVLALTQSDLFYAPSFASESGAPRSTP